MTTQYIEELTKALNLHEKELANTNQNNWKAYLEGVIEGLKYAIKLYEGPPN